MDIATIIGLVGGAVLVLIAILIGSNPLTFLDAPSILIVVGGTLATACIKFTLADVLNSITVAMKAFSIKLGDPDEIIQEMIAYTRIAKTDGLLALESQKPKDPFAAKALRYLADGYEEAVVSDLLNKDIRLTLQRHRVGQNVFKGMASSAPAFGMIGTLIGLVQMLSSMADPSAIGPAMAVALLTTLYGALIANLVCLPLADKLVLRSQQELINKSIVREAVAGITQGVSPMVLEDTLRVYLAPKAREKTVAKGKGEGQKK
jgi:chemotaxis protein MotA